jgi:hypothetical protein
MADLLEILSLAILVAGTLEYAIVMRHREDRRRDRRLEEMTVNLGHQALERMRLLDRGRPIRAWSGFGARFR